MPYQGIYPKANTMIPELGSQELRCLAWAQRRVKRTLETGDFVNALGLSVEQERKVLSRLAKKGMIARVRPGLYLAPDRLIAGGRWSPGENLALETLMRDRGGKYQISGPNAFYRYGWTEQIPNRIYAYNNRISGERTIGTSEFTLIKVGDDRLGGIETVRDSHGIDVVYASKPRAIVDAIVDWTRFDGLPRALTWLRGELKKDDSFAVEIVDTAIRYANQGAIRRIGYALELEDAPRRLIDALETAIHPSSSFIPWNPRRAKRGKVIKRWGIVDNDRES
jgi:predicted transcriptional regulator of viral defense system